MKPGELAERAWSALKGNRLTEARALFAELVSVDASDAQGWRILGTLQGALGEVEAGLASLDRALALAPDAGEAHLGVGKLRLMQGDLEGALAALAAARACDAGLAEAWLLSSGVLGRLERHSEAETAGREALALLPGSLEARLLVANARLWQGEAVAASEAALAQPILVLGLPRSGTSLVAGSLAACGAWTGRTLAGNESNPTGYFENAALREGLLKQQLLQMHADPLGVRVLPPLGGQPAAPRLGGQVLGLLAQQGYAGGAWLYKDAKLTLVWPLWRQAFPHARWVIVRRDAEGVLASCLRTDFMRQHGTDRAFWATWVKAYEQRLAVLQASGVWWREVDPARLIETGGESLAPLVNELGLTWNAAAVGGLVEPRHWHGEAAAAPVVKPAGEAVRCPPLIVNSVPKSGTHLLGKLVSMLGYTDVPLRLYNNLAPRGMQVEETAERVRVGSIWPCLVPFERIGELFLSVGSRRFLQGHLPYSPRLLRLMEAFGLRMVLMLRDPRALALSHANWVPEREFLASHAFYRDKSAEERLRLAITGYRVEPDGPLELGLRTRFEHMLPWMAHPLVYTTRFEWLAGPQAGGSSELQLRELRNIAGHLGLEVDEARFEQIANDLFGGTMTFKGGRIDRWKNAFNDELKALIKDEVGDLIVELGYESDATW